MLIVRFSLDIPNVHNLLFSIILKSVSLYLFLFIFIVCSLVYINLYPDYKHWNKNIKSCILFITIMSLAALFFNKVRNPDKNDNIKYYTVIYNDYKDYNFEEPPSVLSGSHPVKEIPINHKIVTEAYNITENKYGAEYYTNEYFKHLETAYIKGFEINHERAAFKIFFINDFDELLFSIKCIMMYISENFYFFFTTKTNIVICLISYISIFIPLFIAFYTRKSTPKTPYTY